MFVVDSREVEASCDKYQRPKFRLANEARYGYLQHTLQFKAAERFPSAGISRRKTKISRKIMAKSIR